MAQSITVKVYVEDPATEVLTYDQVRLYYDTTPDGSFAGEVSGSPQTLDADTTDYDLVDNAWVSGRWYRWKLFNSGNSATTPLSEAFQATAGSLLDIMAAANRRACGGWSGTLSSAGSSTTIVDVVLLDQGVDAGFARATWFYRPNAVLAANRLRRSSDAAFNTNTGAITMTRAYTDTPAQGEPYYAFAMLPPTDQPGESYSMERCVRDGLAVLRVVDRLNLGEGTSAWATDFSLLTHVGWLTEDMIRNVFLRTTDGNGNYAYQDASKNLRYWEVLENGPEDRQLSIHPAPTTSETVIVEAIRPYITPYGLTDMTDCPFDLAVAATVWALFYHLQFRGRPGRYATELAGAYADLVRAAVDYNVEVSVLP